MICTNRLLAVGFILAAFFSAIEVRSTASQGNGWRTAYGSMFGHPFQRTVSARTQDWNVTLDKWESCPAIALSHECFYFQAQELVSMRPVQFRLANETAQVDALTVISGNRVAILGRATSNLALVTLVSLPSGRISDRFFGFWPAISPDARYVTFVKWFPLHPGFGVSVSDEFLVYDLDKEPVENRTPPDRGASSEPYDVGWPIYPPNASNTPGDNVLEGHDAPVHRLASDGFFWISDHQVAFVDRWSGENTLVIADLANGPKHPLVTARQIPTQSLVNLSGCANKAAPSDLKRWEGDPSILIHVSNISPLPQRLGWLRLTFTRQACLVSPSLDMQIGSGLSP